MKTGDLTRKQLAEIDLRIQGLSKYEGECEVWIGYVDPKGRIRISMRHGGIKETVTVRSVRWNAAHPQSPLGNRLVRMTCGNNLCIKAEHMQTVSQVEVLMANRANVLSQWRVAMSNANRKRRAKLTIEAVRSIRASSETHAALAKQHGVSYQLISQIRRYEIWPDFELGMPLLRRAA